MGRPRKKVDDIKNIKDIKDKKKEKNKFVCFCCGKECTDTNFYNSKSVFFNGVGKVSFCRQCIEDLYKCYYDKYMNEGSLTPEKNAIKRICMMLDIYYGDDVYASTIKRVDKDADGISMIGAYMRTVQLRQYSKYSYDETISNDKKNDPNILALSSDSEIEIDVDEKVVNFFGKGFVKEDYDFLKKEYDDWVTRHECNTKSQEEVFKRLCFTQLELLKATIRGEDTKNLNDTYLKQLDAAKLQPKQSKGDTTAETQTFGTLIDKWENTRPLPEVDEELKDVDKIGLYIDVFFRSHLAKMAGVKNGISNLYSKFMKKYTVERPEYKEEEEENREEIIFDTIFGNQSLDDDNDSEGVV